MMIDNVPQKKENCYCDVGRSKTITDEHIDSGILEEADDIYAYKGYLQG